MEVDAGVNYNFGIVSGPIPSKIGYGIKSYLKETAIPREEL